MVDVPDWCDDELLDLAEKWLATTDQDPPGGWDEWRYRVGEAIHKVQGAQARVSGLTAEWRSCERGAGYGRGVGEFKQVQADQGEAIALLFRVGQKIKLAGKGSGGQERAARSASRNTLRAVDLALALWRDNPDRGSEVLATIDQAITAFFADRPVAT